MEVHTGFRALTDCTAIPTTLKDTIANMRVRSDKHQAWVLDAGIFRFPFERNGVTGLMDEPMGFELRVVLTQDRKKQAKDPFFEIVGDGYILRGRVQDNQTIAFISSECGVDPTHTITDLFKVTIPIVPGTSDTYGVVTFNPPPKRP